MRICHVISNLDNTGGAQRMLSGLLSQLDRCEFESHVISLVDVGKCGARIQQLGIPVEALGMRRGIPSPSAVLRLARRLRSLQPDIVQTWLYHADLLGGLAAKLARQKAVVWNIRHSNLMPGVDKRTTFFTAKCSAKLSSRIPSKIIVNSHNGYEHHAALGYDRQRLVVVPNGVDISKFEISEEARRSVRRELNINETSPLVGISGRYHAQKDHSTFLEAAALIRRRVENCEFLLSGIDVTPENAELTAAIDAANLQDCCHRLGFRSDMPRIHASLDLAVSSSACGEGFPNTVAESMACGKPCVVTDVGDSAFLVGETGRVVPPQNPESLAAACIEVLQLSSTERGQLGRRARERIEEHFELSRITQRYAQLWRDVCSQQGNRQPKAKQRAA